jgi:hypothetical protein
MAPNVAPTFNVGMIGEELPAQYQGCSDADAGIEQLVAPMNRLVVSSSTKSYY